MDTSLRFLPINFKSMQLFQSPGGFIHHQCPHFSQHKPEFVVEVGDVVGVRGVGGVGDGGDVIVRVEVDTVPA